MSVALRIAVVWVTLLVLKSDMFLSSLTASSAGRACLQLASVNHGSATWVSPVRHWSAPGLGGICTVWSLWQCCLSPITSYISALVIHTPYSGLQRLHFKHCFRMCRFIILQRWHCSLWRQLLSHDYHIRISIMIARIRVCTKTLKRNTHYRYRGWGN